MCQRRRFDLVLTGKIAAIEVAQPLTQALKV